MSEDERDQVAVLEVDADLRATVPPDEVEVASRHLVARRLSADPGPWDDDDVADPDSLGLLVLEGLLTRDLEVAGSHSRELLGSGDVIRPWDDDSLSPVSAQASWTILEPTEFAVLDPRFMTVLGRWPKLGGEIIHRVLRRSRWLAVRLAIGNLRGVADQIMLLFWHMAGHWGRVTPEGTLVPHELTHELIAELIGARRPTVTTAISELRAAGQLDRQEDGWLLRGTPPATTA